MMIKQAILIAVIFSYSTLSQTSLGLSFNTGDTEIEAHLNEVNNYASADISIFRKDLAVKFSASNRDLDIFLVTERMHPADVYYGYVISFTSGVKLYDVMKLYKKKKGWGSVAKELGIKPGSNQFHKLKNNTLISIDKEKMHKGGGNSNGKNKMQPDSKNNKGKKN